MNRSIAMLMLLGTAFFWGMAFIAQKTAMDSMGPLTFVASRYIIGGALILPFAIREYRRANITLSPQQWKTIGFLCLNFFMGSWFQQWGLVTTTATNAGFLTGLYVFFVPLIQLFLFRTYPHPVVWISAPLALLGMFLLSGASVNPFGSGDYLVICSGLFWAMQVYLLGTLVSTIKLPFFITAICFISAGLLATIGAFGSENVSWQNFEAGWVEIAYAGIFSTAIAFSLQAVGQRYIPPANAAIIVSAESLVAAAGGALFLAERLTPTGYLGIAILFIAIVSVEAIPWLNRNKAIPG